MNKTKSIVIGVILFLLFDVAIAVLVFAPQSFFTNIFSPRITPIGTSPSSTLLPHKTVQAGSDTSLFAVSLTNKEKLQSILEGLHFWQPNSVAVFSPHGGQEKKLVTVNSLDIHLTDKKQPLGNIVSSKTQQAYAGYGMTYNPAQQAITLSLFIDSTDIATPSASLYNQTFSYLLLSALFDLTHPMDPSKGEPLDRLKGKNEYINNTFTILPSRTLFVISLGK